MRGSSTEGASYRMFFLFGFWLSAFGFRLSAFGFSAFRLSGKKMESHYQLARPFHSDLKLCLTTGKPEVKPTNVFIIKAN
jgi:hypothetical protein